jgi:hypothetical protein
LLSDSDKKSLLNLWFEFIPLRVEFIISQPWFFL